MTNTTDLEIIAAIEQAKYDTLTGELLKQPQVDLETTHVISGGLYARTIRIPAGVVLTGAIHKKDHIDIMQGDVTVTTHEGTKRLTGHHVFETKAGLGRAGFAHSETLWTTICSTGLTDLSEIENELVANPEQLQTRQALIGNVNLHKIGE